MEVLCDFMTFVWKEAQYRIPFDLEYRIYCEATFKLVDKSYTGVGESCVTLNFGPHTKGHFTLV